MNSEWERLDAEFDKAEERAARVEWALLAVLVLALVAAVVL